MPDFGDVNGSTLMQDDRYIGLNFAYRIYPYTVDYEDDVTNDGGSFFSELSPVSTNMSIEYSE